MLQSNYSNLLLTKPIGHHHEVGKFSIKKIITINNDILMDPKEVFPWGNIWCAKVL